MAWAFSVCSIIIIGGGGDGALLVVVVVVAAAAIITTASGPHIRQSQLIFHVDGLKFTVVISVGEFFSVSLFLSVGFFVSNRIEEEEEGGWD
jgi:hypothetical protein